MTNAKKDQLAETLQSPRAFATPADGSNDEEEISLEVAKPSAAISAAEPSSRPAVLAPDAVQATTACLSDEEIFDYREGRGTAQQHARIEAHLDGCSACCTLVFVALQEVGSVSYEVAQPAVARVLTFAPGSTVSARYRIERLAAKSGMGEVYEVLDTLRQKRVALKTVLCTASDDPRAVQALTAEVEHALLVSHPNVCRVYELGEHRNPDDQPPVRFLTMEFVDGETLGKRLRRLPLSVTEARIISRQLLSGLAAAHAKGVLHLDFKSDNVMLRHGSGPPEALIMDFGLSRTRSAGSTAHASEREFRGTPGYMAPEQLECLATSRATDVYAFGIVLFEMLAGRLPFKAESLSALLLLQLRSQPPAPSKMHTGLAPALDAFVLKCLSRDPSKRYPDAASALAALERVTVWEAPAPRAPLRRLRPAWALFGICVLAALIWRARMERLHSRGLGLRPATASAISHPPAQAAPAQQPVAAASLAPGEPMPPAPTPAAVSSPPAPARPESTAKRRLSSRAAAPSAAPAATPASASLSPDERPWKHVPPGGFWVPESGASARADADATDGAAANAGAASPPPAQNSPR